MLRGLLGWKSGACCILDPHCLIWGRTLCISIKISRRSLILLHEDAEMHLETMGESIKSRSLGSRVGLSGFGSQLHYISSLTSLRVSFLIFKMEMKVVPMEQDG